jgi:hypothetical protein
VQGENKVQSGISPQVSELSYDDDDDDDDVHTSKSNLKLCMKKSSIMKKSQVSELSDAHSAMYVL